MRTLKKTLALVLVVALVLSISVIGANAFTDVKSTDTYYEAVTVLNKLGVIDGMTDTTFAPDGTLTRAQAAKIIAFVKLGPTNAKLVSAATTQKFSDVPTSHWAAGYIEYCANLKIVEGVGDGKFDPEGKLTTAAFTKMLLVAVGMDGTSFSGDSWALNVATTAISTKIYDSAIGVSATAEITRAQACALSLKALLYSGSTTTKTTTYYVVEGVPYTTFAAATAAAATATNKTISQISVTEDVAVDSLGYKVFGLTKGTGSDSFARPATTYTATGWTSSLKFNKTPALSFTTATTAGAIYKALGLSSTTAATCYTNGKTGTSTVSLANDATAFSTVVGGQGTLTQVYVDAAGAVTIVCIDTYLALVGDVTKSTTDKYGNTTDPSTALTVYTDATGTAKTYATQDFTKGTYVLVTLADGVVASAVAAESAVGIKTAQGTGYIKVSDTKYATAAQNKLLAADYVSTYTFYKDSYGNVIGAVLKTAAVATDYFYVIKLQDKAASSTTDLFGSTTTAAGAAAQVRMPDGTIKVVNLQLTAVKDASGNITGYTYTGFANAAAVTAGTLTDITAGSLALDVGKWMAYTVNADGTYVLANLTAAYAKVASLTIPSGSAGKVTNEAGMYFTSATKLVVYDTTTKGITTYTGYANFPANTYTQVLFTYASGAVTVDTIYATVTSSASTTASYAYVVAMGDTTAKGTYYTVYVDGVAKNVLVASGSLSVGDVYKNMVLTSSDVLSATGTDLVTLSTSGTLVSGTKVTLAEAAYFVAGSAYNYTTSTVVYTVTGGTMTKSTVAVGQYVVVADSVGVVFIVG